MSVQRTRTNLGDGAGAKPQDDAGSTQADGLRRAGRCQRGGIGRARFLLPLERMVQLLLLNLPQPKRLESLAAVILRVEPDAN